MKTLALVLIRIYRQFLSPLKPPVCRFIPSCSAYAEEAVVRHGVWKGLGLAVGRLLRCHPLYHGPVFDPVPGPSTASGGGNTESDHEV